MQWRWGFESKNDDVRFPVLLDHRIVPFPGSEQAIRTNGSLLDHGLLNGVGGDLFLS